MPVVVGGKNLAVDADYNDPIPFPSMPDGKAGIIERLGWATDLLDSHDGSEQRIGLRDIPRGGIEFSVLALDPGEAALVAGLIQFFQGERWAVPFWPEAQRLAAALPGGSSTIPCETDGVPFRWTDQLDAGYALLWLSPFSWERVRVLAVNPSDVTLVDPTVLDWPAGTILVPARICRLGAEVAMAWETTEASSGRLSFQIVEMQP